MKKIIGQKKRYLLTKDFLKGRKPELFGIFENFGSFSCSWTPIRIPKRIQKSQINTDPWGSESITL
jgi:hypothetical protein